MILQQERLLLSEDRRKPRCRAGVGRAWALGMEARVWVFAPSYQPRDTDKGPTAPEACGEPTDGSQAFPPWEQVEGRPSHSSI